MAKEDLSTRDTEEGGTAAELFDRLHELARRAVRELQLPADWADDLAQETMATLLREGVGPVSDEALAHAVRRLANRERQRRRREVQRGAAPPARVEPCVPVLCPGLAELADHASDRREFLRTLSVACRAVATQPKLLTDRQLRLFFLAYVEGLGLEKLTGLIGAATLRATRDRLYRVSRRIEKELLRSLGSLLKPRSRARFQELVGPNSPEPAFPQKKNKIHTSDGLTDLCDELLLGLGAVVHRIPSQGMS